MTMMPNITPGEWPIPEPVLASQFLDIWHRRTVLPPEQELLLAVLVQARDDLRAFRSARTRRAQRLYEEAYEWVASDDRTWLYAFGNICDILNLSAECLRAELLGDGTLQRLCKTLEQGHGSGVPEPDESSSRDTR